MAAPPGAQPEDVVGFATDCEALLDYDISLYLGRNDDCSHIIEEVLLRRLGVAGKIRLLKELLALHEVNGQPYESLPQELEALFDYRNRIAHSSAIRGDRFHRVRRRKGVSETFRTTPTEVSEQVDRGMRCQSALNGLPMYLMPERRPDAARLDESGRPRSQS